MVIMKQVKARDGLTPDATIEQIVNAHNEAETLLASIGLEPSQHEGETLRSVCQQRHWSEVEVLDWVMKHTNAADIVLEKNSEEIPLVEESLKKWVEYLEKTYINPIENLQKEIDQNFPRVHKIHGNQYTWLKNMQWHYDKFSEALQMYHAFERETFLPAAQNLNSARPTMVTHGSIKRLEKCFSVIERDQERLSRLFQKVRRKGHDFENPDGACSTLCILNENFKLLQEQLEAKFTFENEQLIPRIRRELSKAKS